MSWVWRVLEKIPVLRIACALLLWGLFTSGVLGRLPTVVEVLGLAIFVGVISIFFSRRKSRSKKAKTRSSPKAKRMDRPKAEKIDLGRPIEREINVEKEKKKRARPSAEEIASPVAPKTKRDERTRDRPVEESRPAKVKLNAPPTKVQPSPRSRPIAPATELRWRGNGSSLSHAGFVIENPLTYVSEARSREEEASCIVLTLPVGRVVGNETERLGYDPTYAGLDPNQRACYLDWLARGRSGPLKEIGYAFLFFYGLERRLLIDGEDLDPIVKEVVRLLETYAISGSFDGRLSRFLAFALARSGIATLEDKRFQAVFERSRLPARDEDFLAVALAWFFTKEAPLPATWAMRVARQDPRCPRSVVLDRLGEEFEALFALRYRERFDEGIILKASKRERAISYQPASPSLLKADREDSAVKPVMVPDVLGIQSQFTSVVKVWTDCIEELRPLSRIVAKGNEVVTRAIYEALPEDLRGEIEHPDKSRWDRLVADTTDEQGSALVKVARLAAIHGLEEKPKLTLKQSQSLAQTAESVGLLIEPDARLTKRPYGWNDLVSLFRPEETPARPADPRYQAAALMLELGIQVAAADGSVAVEEVDQIARFLESQFRLDPGDARRLEALKRVLTAQPTSLAGLGKRLQSALNREQREAVGRFLTGLAAANGVIDRKEVAALRAAYRALDIDVKQLNALLEDFRRASREAVEIERGDESTTRGEAGPARISTAPPVITLDDHLINTLINITNEISATLEKEMGDQESSADKPVSPPPKVAPPAPILAAAASRFDGLELRYQPVLDVLLTRPLWPKAEFVSLLRGNSLMAEATCETINTWSEDRFGDFLIVEQGEEYVIQPKLLEGSP